MALAFIALAFAGLLYIPCAASYISFPTSAGPPTGNVLGLSFWGLGFRVWEYEVRGDAPLARMLLRCLLPGPKVRHMMHEIHDA